MTTIKNTRDTLSEAYKDALRIRNAVFVEEQGVPYALEMESPADEAMSVHFVSYDKAGKAVATVRLLDKRDGSVPLIQRMAVISSVRGHGYAAEILSAALDFAKVHGLTEVMLHAQLTARGLYDKMGFVAFGDVFEEAGIQHISMKKEL